VEPVWFGEEGNALTDWVQGQFLLWLYLGQVLTKGQGEPLPRLESGLPCGNGVQTPVML
jgi:hypothetical protein